MISATAIPGLPEIRAGDDLAELILSHLGEHAPLTDEDVIVIAHKAVSKSEGRTRSLRDVEPSERASELAAAQDKDPRHVQVVLEESSEILRAERGVIISLTPHGFICANAGVDASNASEEGTLTLLPRDPDASARGVRARLRELTGGVAPAVVITDSFGRAWRRGQTDVAIGFAGVTALDDWRGRLDNAGRELTATWIAIADELAAAADLARSKDGGQPVILVRGAGRYVHADDGPGIVELVRPASEDLFR